MFFGTSFGMSFKVTCANTSFATICFFYNIYILLDLLPLLLYIFYLHTKVLPYYGCTSTNPKSFAYRIGLGNVKGLVRGRATSGSEMIFKRIKFIIFINIIVKVFNI